MSLRKTILGAAIAGAALLASAAAASAAPGFATSNVNVRSGPGTGYAVVDTLRRGEAVDIERCRGSWCFVSKRGLDGWVSSNYLSRDRGWDRPRPPRPPVFHRPPPPHWGHDRWDRRDRWDRHDRWDRRHHRRDRDSVCIGDRDARFCISN